MFRLACMLSMVVAASNARARDFVLQPRWIAGGSGSSVGDFGTPESVAIDSAGRVVVTDKGRMMLHIYAAADGRPLFDVGGLGTALGRFDRPNGIAVAANGDILVVEQRNRRVQIFDREYRPIGAFGSATTAAGGFVKPMGIALDAAGNIYVTDEARADVQVFDPSGRFLWRFGTTPRLSKVESIEVHPSSARIFVCDEGRSCVNVYDLEGRYLDRFGTEGTGPGQFGNDTNAVRLDARGRIYVNDQGNRRIQVFAADLRHLASFYNADGGMESADGVALSERHNLLCVADQGNNRVLGFDLGEFACRLDAVELAAPAAGIGALTCSTDSTGIAPPSEVWADAPLWFEARATAGDPARIETAIVHARSGRDPRGVTIVLHETAPASNRLRGFLQLATTSGSHQLATSESDTLRFHVAGDADAVVAVVPLAAPRVEALQIPGQDPQRLVHSRPLMSWRFHDPDGKRRQTGAALRLVRHHDGAQLWAAALLGEAATLAYDGPPLAPGEQVRLEVRVASGRMTSAPARLDLQRNHPPGLPSGLEPADGIVVNSQHLELETPTAEDPDADPLELWFEIDCEPRLRSPRLDFLDGIAKWEVPAALLPEGARLRWRVVVDDGHERTRGSWRSVSRGNTPPQPRPQPLDKPRLLLPGSTDCVAAPGMLFAFGDSHAWRLDLHDVRGRRVLGTRGIPGSTWTWTGRDAAGRRLARGTYFLRARSGTTTVHTRIVWLAP